jgi:hypothetical protein
MEGWGRPGCFYKIQDTKTALAFIFKDMVFLPDPPALSFHSAPPLLTLNSNPSSAIHHDVLLLSRRPLPTYRFRRNRWPLLGHRDRSVFDRRHLREHCDMQLLPWLTHPRRLSQRRSRRYVLLGWVAGLGFV